MTTGDAYTEEEVNQMLATQAINLRLEHLTEAVTVLDTRVTAGMRDEERGQAKMMHKIEEGANDRRRAETELKKEAELRHQEYHDTFVKKSDLRMYAILVITAVTMTVSAITYIGAASTKASYDVQMKQLMSRVEVLMQEIK